MPSDGSDANNPNVVVDNKFTPTQDAPVVIAGTIPYMAPEVLKSIGTVPTASVSSPKQVQPLKLNLPDPLLLAQAQDIWALGCCVLEMSTGKQPWQNKKFDNVLAAYHYIAGPGSDGVLPSELDEMKGVGAISFTRECLQREVDKRPTADELNKHMFL